jgi:hypothetical protein
MRYTIITKDDIVVPPPPDDDWSWLWYIPC